MTGTEHITQWSPGEPEKPGKLVSELIEALNAHMKEKGIEAEEYDFCVAPSLRYDAPGTRIPAIYWQLVAYAVEGGSEGYYVHAGCILRIEAGDPTPYARYLDFGFAKTYSAESAYALAKEAQRWLTAIRWN